MEQIMYYFNLILSKYKYRIKIGMWTIAPFNKCPLAFATVAPRYI